MMAGIVRATTMLILPPVAAFAVGEDWSAVGAALGKTGTERPGGMDRNRLIASIVRAELSWLLGWPYDGSEPARGAGALRRIPSAAITGAVAEARTLAVRTRR